MLFAWSSSAESRRINPPSASSLSEVLKVATRKVPGAAGMVRGASTCAGRASAGTGAADAAGATVLAVAGG